MKKITPVVFIISLVALFFIFDLDRYLTLQNIKESQATFTVWWASSSLLTGGSFFLFYTAVTALSLPGATIMTLMGLTSIRTIAFYRVSQIGMLAGTLAWANAGTQLARIENPGDIVSAPLFFSFALLGIFPLLAKKMEQFILRNKVYKGCRKPRSFDRNLVVIGAGAAGLVSAYLAASVKARIRLVEANNTPQAIGKRHMSPKDCLHLFNAIIPGGGPEPCCATY